MINEVIGKSKSTGYLREMGDVKAEELEFPNGYRVLAVQVYGQKAVIKGPGPWHDFIGHRKEVDFLVEQWLEKSSFITSQQHQQFHESMTEEKTPQSGIGPSGLPTDLNARMEQLHRDLADLSWMVKPANDPAKTSGSKAQSKRAS